MDELIADLRDVHAPAPPAGISSLPIITIALAVVVLGVAAGIAFARARQGWRAEAKALLSAAAAEPSARGLEVAAVVLRRLALLQGGARTAKLSGDAWLDELDRQYRTRFFTLGNGRIFGDALYRPVAPDIDVAAIIIQLRRLVRRRGWMPW